MKRSAVTNVAFAVALVGALASLSGCAAHSAYVVTAVHEEKIDGRLDAQWFQRLNLRREGWALGGRARVLPDRTEGRHGVSHRGRLPVRDVRAVIKQ